MRGAGRGDHRSRPSPTGPATPVGPTDDRDHPGRVIGVGADSVLECVGTPEAMRQALSCARPGGNVGFVGVPHDVAIDGQELFFSHVGLRGGPAPVRRFLPDLIERVLSGRIDPGKVFDQTLPLGEVAEGYRAMDERRAIKTLLVP